ncbi:hypothetical protein Tco_1209823 [Tanacetum coccineum]
MVDAHLGTRLKDSIQKALRSCTAEFKKEAQADKKRYIDLIEKSVKDIINDEVKTQIPQILPNAMSDFTTLMIKSTITESLEDSAQVEELSHIVDDTEVQHNQGQDMGKKYLFDLSKPLLLIMDRGHQVVLVDYFINNDLEYLRGGRSSRKYTTSTTKTKAAKYDIQAFIDMVSTYMESGKRNSTTRRIVILKRVKDLQLGVESYQKKLNITKPETFRLMRTDKLYKFSDGTLTSVRSVLHDIASNLKMDYLLKRRWSSLDRKRSRT